MKYNEVHAKHGATTVTVNCINVFLTGINGKRVRIHGAGRRSKGWEQDAQRKQELLKAIENSPGSFDEIMAYLKAEE